MSMTLENTTGYTQMQLDLLNSEFERRFADGDWSEDRAQSAQWFSGEVARRSAEGEKS